MPHEGYGSCTEFTIQGCSLDVTPDRRDCAPLDRAVQVIGEPDILLRQAVERLSAPALLLRPKRGAGILRSCKLGSSSVLAGGSDAHGTAVPA